MQTLELNNKKSELLKEVNILVSLKKKLYSNIDITSPVSLEEKTLQNQINDLFSQINSIVTEIRNIKN